MDITELKPNHTLNILKDGHLLKKNLQTIDEKQYNVCNINHSYKSFQKNSKEFNNDFINFKKRRTYSYNNYDNFKKNSHNIYNNLHKPPDKFTKIELNDFCKNNVNCTENTNNIDNDDDNIININNCTDNENDNKIVHNNKNENLYKNIKESKNYPDIDIDINKLNSEYLLRDGYLLKYQNIEINIPITSYGIILYTNEKNKYLKYLVCQRRDSISYIQYLQDLIEEKNILKYINLMSKEEKKRCLEYYYKNDTHSIWKDLWVNNKSKIYINEYNRCTKMFPINMKKYIEYFKDDSIGQKENQWFFPKGRIHKNENEIDCAIREFEEETNISSKSIYVNKNVTFEEYYIGSNNLIYRTIYYVAYIPYIPKKTYKYYPNNIRKKFISSEIYDMEWLDFNDMINLLDKTKKDILTKVNNYIIKKKKF